MSNFLLGGLFMRRNYPVFDDIFQMKMPGTRPGTFVLAVWSEVDR
jgi:hypothetical protein